MRPPAPTAHRGDRGAAAQHAADQVHVDLLMHRGGAGFGQSARRKAAGNMDRGPERADALVESGNVGLIRQIAGDTGDDLLVVAQPKALRLRFVEARHVADRAGLDQRGDDGGAERAGAASDNDVTIAKIHLGSLHAGSDHRRSRN